MPIEAELPEQLGYARILVEPRRELGADTPLRDLAVELDDLVLTYGDHVGRPGLRAAIAAPAPRLGADDVLVTPGAAAALFIVHTTLLGPGDELVVVRPNTPRTSRRRGRSGRLSATSTSTTPTSGRSTPTGSPR